MGAIGLYRADTMLHVAHLDHEIPRRAKPDEICREPQGCNAGTIYRGTNSTFAAHDGNLMDGRGDRGWAAFLPNATVAFLLHDR